MNKYKVALVDDHSMLRHGLATVVDSIDNYTTVAQCDNGEDFIHAVKTQRLLPDIVLLDVSMPVMDGFETAKWIAENLPSAKILVLSMFDDEKSIIRMIKNGARGYILKDGEPEELKIALHNVLTQGYHFNDLVNGKLVHMVVTNNNRNLPTQYTEVPLTSREETFLKYCCSEMTYKEIATLMNVSNRTVEGYRDQLFVKLQLKTRVGLVLYAIKNRVYII
jgi:DNA-binding NarL/FixJ family response regulator